jgi:hypothetical protein
MWSASRTLQCNGAIKTSQQQTVFSAWSVPRSYLEDKLALQGIRASSIHKRQTRPLVREGFPQKQDRNCQTVINIRSWAPDGTRHQDLLTDRQSQCDFDFATKQLRVLLWSVNQRATEAEESPLLRFVTRKRLVKTLQRNSHCGELLLSKD